jgi:Zn-dependent peptidase ImmA (M78 family)/transcriptional regulator with XRE-family HTH domain
MLTPTRLALARKRRGLTLTRLAKDVSLSTRSLSAFENGHATPSPETLAALAAALDVSPRFLDGQDLEEIPVGAVSFRALSKMTARQRDSALGCGGVALLIDEWIEARFSLPGVDVPTLTGYEPEHAAEVLRARWGLGEKPISNLLHLVEAHGVRVYSLTEDNRNLDAFSLYWHGRPVVMISTQKSGERGRFDLAHELGHLVLHSEYRELDRPEAETEANRFAAAFLMPRASVLAYNLFNADVSRILKAKSIWQVAAMALAHRLHELGLMTDWVYRSACVQLSRLGYRSSEPGGIPRESSQLLAKVFQSLREDDDGPAAIATAIGIPVEELNDHVFGLTITAVPSAQTVSLPPRRPSLRVVQSGE